MSHARFEIPADLGIPYAACKSLSGDVAAAEDHTLRWIKSMGLVRSAKAEAYIREWQFASAIGRCYPALTGTELIVTTDWWAWAYLFDDFYFGKYHNDPVTAAQMVSYFMLAADADSSRTSRSPEIPLLDAFVDVNSRLAAVADPTWMARYRQHMIVYFSGVLQRVLFERQHRTPGLAETLELRWREGCPAYMDFLDLGTSRTIPDVIYTSSSLEAMVRSAYQISLMVNDVYSLPKDRGTKEPNIVIAIERERSVATTEAFAEMHTTISARVIEFAEAEKEVSELLESIQADSALRLRVADYIAALKLFLGGLANYHIECPRYSEDPRHAAPLGDGRGYLEDLSAVEEPA